MRTLVIEWQRLTDERGKTCSRCSSTEQEIEEAVRDLNLMLNPLGIEVRRVKGTLDWDQFKKDTLQSNRILIAGRAIEDWLGAGSGQSQCCDLCGGEPCRTIEISDQTYETIPAGLIIQAGLMAAMQIFGIQWPDKDSNKALAPPGR